MDRVVVVLTGPPGAGKTTIARASGLDVYDVDDEQWSSTRHFGAALDRIRHDPDARAVVIRTAPRSADRAKVCRQVDATHCYLITADRATLADRIARRDRDDVANTLAGLKVWFEKHDRDDGVAQWPGWPSVLGRRTLRDW